MTTTAYPTRPVVQDEGRLFGWMSIVVIGVTAGGFGPRYLRGFAPPGMPWWVHLHGAVMSSWLVLFAAQGWLARRRFLAWHRRLGAFSVALVAAMVVLAVATSALALGRGDVPAFFTGAQMLSADLVNLAVFLAFYAAAISMRRRIDWHRRLMLTAAILLTWPALVRLVAQQHVAMQAIVPASIAVLLALVLVEPAWILARRRRPHPASLWGAGAAALLLPLNTGLGNSALFQSIAARLAA